MPLDRDAPDASKPPPRGVGNQYPVAAFASEGFAVLRPNPRGSSGYGRTFRYANHKDWGGGDLQDILSGVDHVVASGVAVVRSG